MELIICVAKSDDHDAIVSLAEKRAKIRRDLEPSRATQMNAGADLAKGRYCFFLHIDSRPPPHFYDLIAKTLSSTKHIAGAFSHRFHERDSCSLAIISWINRLRYSVTGVYYGDQGLFLKAEDFKLVGGFDNLPLFEDGAMVKKLKQRGSVICLKEIMQTSGRRFLKNGPWKTFFWMWGIVCVYYAGLDLRKKAERYRET